MDKQCLEVFSIGDSEATDSSRHLVVAHSMWEAIEYYFTVLNPGGYPFDLSAQRHVYQVLRTDENGLTKYVDVKKLISDVEEVPSVIGEQHGLTLFNVHDRYGIIAHTLSDALELYKSLVTPEDYSRLLWWLDFYEDWEYGIGFYPEEPIEPLPLEDVITVIDRYGVEETCTVQQHVRWALQEGGIDKAKVWFRYEKDGVLTKVYAKQDEMFVNEIKIIEDAEAIR